MEKKSPAGCVMKQGICERVHEAVSRTGAVTWYLAHSQEEVTWTGKPQTRVLSPTFFTCNLGQIM